MVDLKELERRLDESLAHETKESLNSWLDKERANSIEYSLEGCSFSLPFDHLFKFSLDLPNRNSQFEGVDICAGELNYSTAA